MVPENMKAYQKIVTLRMTIFDTALDFGENNIPISGHPKGL